MYANKNNYYPVILSQKVNEGEWEASNKRQLFWRINAIKIDLKTVKNLMKVVKGKLKTVS